MENSINFCKMLSLHLYDDVLGNCSYRQNPSSCQGSSSFFKKFSSVFMQKR